MGASLRGGMAPFIVQARGRSLAWGAFDAARRSAFAIRHRRIYPGWLFWEASLIALCSE